MAVARRRPVGQLRPGRAVPGPGIDVGELAGMAPASVEDQTPVPRLVGGARAAPRGRRGPRGSDVHPGVALQLPEIVEIHTGADAAEDGDPAVRGVVDESVVRAGPEGPSRR